jgi:iron complex transport system substrate-binding protein
MRIVSLLPGATDIVAALGASDELVGHTHECEAPVPASPTPIVTRSAIPAHAPAGEVDRLVRAASERSDALYGLDESLIAALAPDVILTQAVCDVCAVREGDVRALADRLTPIPVVVTLDAGTLDGVMEDIMRVGRALELEGRARALVAGLVERMRRVHIALHQAAAPRPRVAVIEWTDPVFTAGHWVPEMVHRAGGMEVMARAGERSRAVADVDVSSASPDVVVIAPCGYELDRAAEEGRALALRETWRWMTRARVWAVEAKSLLSRPGPGLVTGIETLAAILHPAIFPPPANGRAVLLHG